MCFTCSVGLVFDCLRPFSQQGLFADEYVVLITRAVFELAYLIIFARVWALRAL